MKIKQSNKKPARIEMIPLIDVVFLLLVFFIYAMLSMAVHRSLPVSLPVSSSAAVSTELNLTVTARQNGEVFLDKRKVSLEQMQKILVDKSREAGDEKSVQVDIFADKALSYQELYKILDVIKNAGISNVSLQAGSDK